jgi:uncharacterized membrane protein YphA (DoxX/SURF4 family)
MTDLKPFTLLVLRLSLGLLMLVWGADKFANPEHGVRVAEHFYFGLLGARGLMPLLGSAQLALAALVLLGAARRVAYPVLVAVTGLTLVGVWRSVVDPWGWYLEGTNALFFPSLIVFAGALVLLAFRGDERFAVDAVMARRGAMRAPRPRAARSPGT